MAFFLDSLNSEQLAKPGIDPNDALNDATCMLSIVAEQMDYAMAALCNSSNEDAQSAHSSLAGTAMLLEMARAILSSGHSTLLKARQGNIPTKP